MSDAFPLVRFSTDAIPQAQRASVLREMYARQLVRFDFEQLPDRPLQLAFSARALPGLTVTSGLTSGLRAQRTHSMVGDADDTLFLGATLRGTVEARQRGKDVIMGAGDAVLLSAADAQDTRTSGSVAYLGVQFSRATLAPLVLGLDDAVMQRVPRDAGALKLLTNYARWLVEDDALLSPHLAQVATTHLSDLVAVALGATRDATAIAQGRGIRAARLRAIQDDIAGHLHDGGLSLEQVAARQGISISYVRKLFESEHTSFSDFVLTLRLVRAHRFLVDPTFVHRSIGDIAFEAGFGDLSYFNRAFRRRFGATPSDVREAARRGGACA